jgi:hypothetical protein
LKGSDAKADPFLLAKRSAIMKILLKGTVKTGGKYFKPGDAIDVDKASAAQLIKDGVAELIEEVESEETPKKPANNGKKK